MDETNIYQDYIDANVFENLNGINVTDKVERKNGFTYLSWSWAWGELKKRYPDATYKVYENANGWMYHTDGKTAWVKVGVTVKGLEHIEILPVMNFKNNSIPISDITSVDANKAVQRALTKAIARHGLGLYIYSGEDLPEQDTSYTPTPKQTTPKQTAPKTEEPKVIKKFKCSDCGNLIKDHQGVSAEKIAEATRKKYGVMICMDCSAKRRAEAEQQTAPQPVPSEPQVTEPVEEDGGELPFDLA